jgi:hypothetical protein
VAPAGWYPVAGTTQQRWWDGARWTEHVYPPVATAAPASPAYAPQGTVASPTTQTEHRAPAGTAPGTVWFWLLAVGAPVLALLDLIPTSVFLGQVVNGDSTDPAALAASPFTPAYLIAALCGWFIYAVCVVFALLDWRELRAHGVPKPFHWAWSFFVIAVGWPAVYMIGRTVVVKRRTGRGMAPLWVFIGLEVATFIVTVVVVIVVFVQGFNDLAYSAGNLG